jgi:FtsZ-binding cell division protein ZapB
MKIHIASDHIQVLYQKIEELKKDRGIINTAQEINLNEELVYSRHLRIKQGDSNTPMNQDEKVTTLGSYQLSPYIDKTNIRY